MALTQLGVWMLTLPRAKPPDDFVRAVVCRTTHGRTVRRRSDGAAAAGRCCSGRTDPLPPRRPGLGLRRMAKPPTVAPERRGQDREGLLLGTSGPEVQSLSENIWMMDSAMAADVGGLDNAWDGGDIAKDSSTAAATGSGAAEGGEAADGGSTASAPPCPPLRCGGGKAADGGSDGAGAAAAGPGGSALGDDSDDIARDSSGRQRRHRQRFLHCRGDRVWGCGGW